MERPMARGISVLVAAVFLALASMGIGWADGRDGIRSTRPLSDGTFMRGGGIDSTRPLSDGTFMRGGGLDSTRPLSDPGFAVRSPADAPVTAPVGSVDVVLPIALATAVTALAGGTLIVIARRRRRLQPA